ncbi:unnamed protein product [Coccothraustes coccothraustes]
MRFPRPPSHHQGHPRPSSPWKCLDCPCPKLVGSAHKPHPRSRLFWPGLPAAATRGWSPDDVTTNAQMLSLCHSRKCTRTKKSQHYDAESHSWLRPHTCCCHSFNTSAAKAPTAPRNHVTDGHTRPPQREPKSPPDYQPQRRRPCNPTSSSSITTPIRHHPSTY